MASPAAGKAGKGTPAISSAAASDPVPVVEDVPADEEPPGEEPPGEEPPSKKPANDEHPLLRLDGMVLDTRTEEEPNRIGQLSRSSPQARMNTNLFEASYGQSDLDRQWTLPHHS